MNIQIANNIFDETYHMLVSAITLGADHRKLKICITLFHGIEETYSIVFVWVLLKFLVSELIASL